MNKEEKCKELLEKIKQTPDNIIEEAIDSLSEKMNKEENMWKPKYLGIFSEEERKQIENKEIEESKKCLNEIIQNTYSEGKAIKLENLKYYIEQLEFENNALKAEHNHNITKTKELEQKESILDKVTDKLKEIRRELDDDGFTYYAQEITKIENIIEGENHE